MRLFYRNTGSCSRPRRDERAALSAAAPEGSPSGAFFSRAQARALRRFGPQVGVADEVRIPGGESARALAAAVIEPYAPAVLDVTLRVGCHLVFEVAGTSTLLLNVQPLRRRWQRVVAESLTLDPDLQGEEYIDTHDNHIHRLLLRQGTNTIHHDAIVAVSSRPDNHDLVNLWPISVADLPPALLRYTLPSRYCDSDRLTDFAWQKFGRIEHGLPRVQAISEWVHRNIEYAYQSGRPDLSAGDVLHRGYGVCRDFAHLAIALNRTFNLPSRYVTGHLPDIGFPDPLGHMDFHAYSEVYLGGRWITSDARFHVPRIGRVKVSCGLDAVDGAFSTIYGGANLSYFEIWAYQIPRGSVSVGDPVDLSKRLDNRWRIQTDAAGWGT